MTATQGDAGSYTSIQSSLFIELKYFVLFFYSFHPAKIIS